MRWLHRGALVAVFALGLGLGAGTAAQAFPVVGTCASATNPRLYEFVEGYAPWTEVRRNAFSEGGDKWEAVQAPGGGSFVTVREVVGTEMGYYASLDNLSAQSAKGKFTCTGGFQMDIWEAGGIEISFYNQMGMATHEIGHSLDLRHPGTSDSFGTTGGGGLPTEQPSMATCAADFAENMTLAQDDYASLGFHYTGTNEAHANTSFENGASYWGYSGGAWGSAMTSGGEDGPGYLLLQGPEGGSTYQTVRVTDPGQFRARVNFKKYYSASSGYIFVGIYARAVEYETVVPGDCEAGSGVNFPNDWNLNEPSVPSTTFTLTNATVYLTPTTTWQWLPETGWWTPDSSFEGADVRIRIYNYMTLEGSSTPVRIDHARAYSG